MKCPKPSTDQIRKKYLDPLVNLGLVNKHDSRLDLKSNIYSLVDQSTASHNDTLEKFAVRDPDVFPTKDLPRTIIKKNRNIQRGRA